MQVSMNTLQHLGMNLYSNVPAVLSEIVANAWDADASKVEINIDKQANTITIDDTGCGMTRDQVIDQFLVVGFQRRKMQGETTDKGRKPMGRKGIGKLSAFSVASVVDVFTCSSTEKTAFRIDRNALRSENTRNDNQSYLLEELQGWPDGLTTGTRIVLSDVEKNLTEVTISALRRRIARRFTIIGPKYDFEVLVNGLKLKPEDRSYYNSLEYVWTYGESRDFSTLCKNLKRPPVDRNDWIRKQLPENGMKISGWIGTVMSPRQLAKEGDNLNRIAIFMRGKLAQEDILEDFNLKEIYAVYAVGEIHCDDLDNDKCNDIATSNRQSLKLDDKRFRSLRAAISKELHHVSSCWSKWRREDGSAQLVKSVPAVSYWLNGLQGDTRTKAKRWIGRLNTLRIEDEHDRTELLKASILAFESYRRKEQIDRLDEFSDDNLAGLLPVFGDIDDLELSYYGQIVLMRIGVIRKLKKMLDKDVKEKQLQAFIFKHLWLIDPSWERTRGSEAIETSITKFLKANTKSLPPEQRKARIDIAYRSVSASHVIIEMKRNSVATPIDVLVKQINKYLEGVENIIATTDWKDWPVRIIVLVGTPPPEWNSKSGRLRVEQILGALGAQLVFYDHIIHNTLAAYTDYLEEHKKVDSLLGLFNSIDDFSTVVRPVKKDKPMKSGKLFVKDKPVMKAAV